MFEFFVKSTQTLVLFGVPFFLGVIILSKIFLEKRLIVLISGGLLLGLGILMALINEFRFFLDIRLSLWYSLKIEFICALGILLITKRKKRDSQTNKNTKQNILLIVGIALIGAMATSFFFTYPASKGVLNDAWWGHYLFSWQIRYQEAFPLHRVFSPWDSVYYHYGPDILASIWSHFFLWDVHEGFVLNIALFVFCGFLLSFSHCYDLTKNIFFSLIAAGLTFVAGNSRFVYLFGESFNGGTILTAVNSHTIEGPLEMMFTPSHAMGIPYSFLLLILLKKIYIRPSFAKYVCFGLAVGISSMIAEWYFGLIFLATLILSINRYRIFKMKNGKRLGFVGLSLVVSLFISFSNNSYLAGFMQRFKVTGESIHNHFTRNYLNYNLEKVMDEDAKKILKNRVKGVEEEIEEGVEAKKVSLSMPSIYFDVVPDLIPFKLNVDHFGYFPSWEAGGSNHSAYVKIFSWKVFLECFPVVLIGLFFPFFLNKNVRFSGIFIPLNSMIWIGFLMPAVLDWGYRSADLLRFMVPVVSFSGFATAVLLFSLWEKGKLHFKVTSIILLIISLLSPLLLSIAGLMPKTFETVKKVSGTAATLQETLENTNSANSSVKLTRESEQNKSEVFGYLSRFIGNFLFPLIRQNENVGFLVSASLLPPQENFPEWMKFSSFTGLMVPAGVHWSESVHSNIYKRVITDLSLEAISMLEIKWIVDTNLFEDEKLIKVRKKLKNNPHFFLVTKFAHNAYWMKLYKVSSK